MNEDTGTQNEGGDAPAEDSGGFDLSPVMERVDELSSSINEIRGALTPQEQTQEEQPLQNPWEPEGYQPEDYEFQDPNDPALQHQQAQQVDAYLMDRIGREQAPIAQEIQALRGELGEVRLDRAVEDLEGRYPLLREPEHAEAALNEAHQLAEQAGNPALATNPAVIEKCHLALRAMESAQSETPASTNQVPLEGAGGANPSDSQESDEDIVQRIMAQSRGSYGTAGLLGGG